MVEEFNRSQTFSLTNCNPYRGMPPYYTPCTSVLVRGMVTSATGRGGGGIIRDIFFFPRWLGVPRGSDRRVPCAV